MLDTLVLRPPFALLGGWLLLLLLVPALAGEHSGGPWGECKSDTPTAQRRLAFDLAEGAGRGSGGAERPGGVRGGALSRPAGRIPPIPT